MKPNRNHTQNPSSPSTRNLLPTLCAAALLLAGAQSSLAQSGTWINTLSDSWSNTVSWASGTVANGAGNTADFSTVDLTAQTTVTLDVARTLGTLLFGDTDTNTPNGWVIGNGGVAANTIAATNITVNPIFAMNSEAATNDASIAAVITGSGVVKSGAGTLILTSSNAFTSLQVDAGVAAMGATNAAGPGNRRIIYNGGGIRAVGVVPIGNTNLVLNSGHLYAPPGNYDVLNGPIIGSNSATLFIHATSGRFTINGGATTLTNFFGTIDFADSAAGLVRVNLGSGTNYDCSAITFNMNTNSGRMAPRATAPIATFRIGSLAGGPNTRVESSEQGASTLLTWEVGALNTSTLYEGRLINYTGLAARNGALKKVGSGRLTLTHTASAYTGNTTVSAGTLALSNSAAISASPVISVEAGAKFDVSGFTNGTWSTTAAQSLAGTGGVIGNVGITNGTIAPGVGGVGTLAFTNNLSLDGALGTVTNLLKLTSSGIGDLIQVAGDLSFSNIVVMRVVPTGASIPDGTYTLMKWGGALIGDTNNMALSYPAQPGTFVLQTNLVAKEIRLVVSGVTPAANLVWKGDGVANDWDSATLNWLNGATPSLFVNADKVTFNDTGSNNVPVNLAANVNPGALIFNATKPYTLASSGAFSIIGSSTLVKSNTGIVTVTANNSFAGGTLIDNGAVQIGDGVNASGSLGAGNITNNAKLIYNRPDALTNANLIVGSGSVIQSGPAALTIAGANTYSGGTVASNGTINLAAYNTLGSGPLNMAGGTVIIVLSGGATTGVSNNIVVTQDSVLQYNAGNSFAAVILAPISGTPGKTLTINHAPNGGQDRLRLYSAFTNDANVVLNDPAVWIAPYLGSGAQQYNGVVSGPGSFVHRGGGGTVVFNTNNTFTGDARMTTGTYGVGVDSVGTWPALTSSPLGLGSLVLTNESDGVGGNGGITAVNGARNVENHVAYSRTNEFTLIVSGANDLTLSGPVSLHGQVDGFGGVDRTFQIDTNKTTFAGPVGDNALNCGVIKTGSGILLLNGTNTYTGTTLVSAGTLGGTGVVVGPVVVSATGTLAPGASIGTLTVSNDLNIAGSLAIEINKSIAATNDRVVVSGGLTNTGIGTVTVTNLGPAFVAGDSFKLFSKPVVGGATLTIAPAPGAGLIWTNKLAFDGSIAVLATNAGPVIPTNPTNITFTAGGGNLTLSWPADHIGWSLQAQTNTRAVGLKTNWFTITGYETTNTAVIPISPASPTVFYRLNYLIP